MCYRFFWNADSARVVASVLRSNPKLKTVTGIKSVSSALMAILIFIAIAGPVVSQAQTPAASAADISARVDSYIAAEMRAEKIPGLALGVVQNGQMIKAQGYGLANVELDVPVKLETIFQTGSVGKQFTATAVMMLVEDGKVRLDDPIGKYLSGVPAAWNSITVRNLLTHTSGIPDYESDSLTKKDAAFIDLRKDYTEAELFQKFTSLPLDFLPGSKWSYSNTSYVLLGILIHKVTGQFYGDVLQERVFRPLGMTSTRIISEADIIPNRAAGYRLVKGELKNQEWVSPALNTTADGALYTNIIDMAKWDGALYTEKLLKQGSLDQMWSPVQLTTGKSYPYGFGWRVTTVNDHRLIEHGGAWQGFTTQISRFVDDKFTVIVLTNLDSEHSQPDKIAHDVAALYLPALKPIEQKPIADNEPQVTALLRATLEGLASGEPNLDSFAAGQRNVWTPERTAGLRDLLKSLGTLKSIDLLERRQSAGSRSYRYRTVFSDRTMFVYFTLDSDGKISDWQIRPT
jgi:CubicO group peptidase (beta-lactamase class C family)